MRDRKVWKVLVAAVVVAGVVVCWIAAVCDHRVLRVQVAGAGGVGAVLCWTAARPGRLAWRAVALVLC